MRILIKTKKPQKDVTPNITPKKKDKMTSTRAPVVPFNIKTRATMPLLVSLKSLIFTSKGIYS